MKFDLNQCIEILERTPLVLTSLLGGISDAWVSANEGLDSWSPFDVLGHLVHGEKTDWIPRAKIILNHHPDGRFIPFDRFAQYEDSKGKTIPVLLKEFNHLRAENIHSLMSMSLTEDQLTWTGIHPDFGSVSMRQLLSTWCVHDLNHIYQITRVMAFQMRDEVGPWRQYLGIVKTVNSEE